MRAHIFEVLLRAALLFHQFQNAADILFVGKNGGVDDRLFDFLNLAWVRPARRIVDFDYGTVSERYLVTHAGSGRDQVQFVFALQSFLDDLHVQQSKESAAESEAESDRTFRLKEE